MNSVAVAIIGRPCVVWRRLAAAAIVVVLSASAVAQLSIDQIGTDKARYAPGEAPQFSMRLTGATSRPLEARISYWRRGAVVATQSLPVSGDAASWSWAMPNADFEGYLAEVELVSDDLVVDRATIGIDASSDWTVFPRYGFLSKYSQTTAPSRDAVMDNLNRYHINGVQFYDWHHEHHDPLRGTAEAPAASWLDVANRTNYFSTVAGYIDDAHKRGMAAMSYNLAYGALESGPADGVQNAWRLYRDQAATDPDRHELPSSWMSDIYLMDPGNAAWQDYLADKTGEAFAALPFDGWHVDQLGYRGQLYNQGGSPVDLPSAMGDFLSEMQSRFPDKRFAFNAVNQYGQAELASARPDFLYTEVWGPNENYNDLANIIRNNHVLGGGLNTVLAAYMNYDRSQSYGTFNTPGVLLTDAVIFANGGAHLELGEHMLANEYFPNDNLRMPGQLQTQLTAYYDFLVGYQNLLRGGGRFGQTELSSPSAPFSLATAQQGAVQVISKTVGESEVFHLINFTDATHMNWRDNQANQAEPSEMAGLDLRFRTRKKIQRLWAASPDAGGAPVALEFTQTEDGEVRFELPSLKYWSMIVAEPVSGAEYFQGADNSANPLYAAGGWSDGMNGGEGFGPWRLRATATSGGYAGFFRQDSPQAGIDNAGLPSAAGGAAWTSFANKGQGVEAATAFRAFDRPLDGEQDAFSITIENGLVTGAVGFALRTGDQSDSPDEYNAGARMQLYFEGGGANYLLLDGSGAPFDTGVPFTLAGIDVEVMLTGADSYDLRISRFDEPGDVTPSVTMLEGRTLAGTGAIGSLALFQYDGPQSSDATVQSDVFFNNLSYTAYRLAFLAGDYNNDGVVDAADYVVWRDRLGDRDPLPNDDTPGVGPDDYERWRLHYGETVGGANAAQIAVPEAEALGLGVMSIAPLLRRRLRPIGPSPCETRTGAPQARPRGEP